MEKQPDNLTTRIFLIRHASAYNEQGWQEDGYSLSELGKKQADALAQRLKNTKVDRIYCSPIPRSFETCNVVAAYHPNIVPIVDESLQELSWEFWPELGHFHYDNAKELKSKLGADDQLKLLGAVQKKGLDILANLYAENEGKTVFVFTHGNLIRAIVSAVMESGIRGFLSLAVDLASITILDLEDDTYHIVTVSDGCHTLSIS